MKRNIFLSVFLPLFLCAAILTLGYFSPTLFSRVMPNFKNKESAAQITGAESPLYLEDPSSLILPPWNDIDDSKSQMYASDNQSVPYSIKCALQTTYKHMPKAPATVVSIPITTNCKTLMFILICPIFTCAALLNLF